MSTYAVLGSTGNCGSALIRNLLDHHPQSRINAYCRSEAKLHRIVPEVVDHKQVRVFEGSINDNTLMDNCIRGTKAVFLAVTSNDNIPGVRLNTDTAIVVIRTLYRLRDEASPGSYTPPKLVLLSACCFDEHLGRTQPKWFRPIMLRAASNVYSDLQRAEDVMRSHDHWIKSIYIKPAGLSPDVARGHRLTFDDQESFLSYMDLAGGMIEAADDDEGRYDGRSVGVVNKVPGKGARVPLDTPFLISMGFIRYLFPFLHPYLPESTLGKW
ncbi:putative NAD-dependent epimerase/dehydratase [Hypoxylon sp. FL1150]|nr:putative NAD-dependent epimerase/dehydratase [Hypoxylon sp. FL1150]